MKFPIEWHERNLKNQEGYVAQLKERLRQEIKTYIVARRRLAFHRLQVQEAKRQGKEGFDEERFLQKYKPVNFRVK